MKGLNSMKFKDIITGHIYFEVMNRGIFISMETTKVYTLKEALAASNLALWKG